jgi:tetratricopeptide (TPR) repeat protein
MLAFSKRLIYALSNKIRQRDPEYADGIEAEGKLSIDFAKVKKSPFDIKPETSYNANLSKGSLELKLKKHNCIAWVDIPEQEYQDHVIEAKFRLDSFGGYAAAGIIFRIMDDDSYYMALVSSKGYFRLDVVKDNAPRTLIAWTEISDFNGINISMKIITYGTYLIFIVNERWLGEVNDNTVVCGKLGFALASYTEEKQETESKEFVCKANLDYISVDTRIRSIEECFNKWTNDSNINADSRLRLAETFAVMDEPVKSLEQINRAWKRRDEVISTVSVTTGIRTKRELLLAARMSYRLGHYNEAEEHIDAILDQWSNTPEGRLAHTEKMKIFNELNKFEELKQFVAVNASKINKDIDYYTILGRCYWELKDYADSAEAWDKAFETNNKDEIVNGVYAANAANAHELAENKKGALARYIDAGRIFLNQDNSAELAAIMPKLSLLGKRSWEACALIGKWAFSMEDYERCITEFSDAEKLRCTLKPRPKADPAVYYLWGLVLHLQGKTKTAIRLLERSVKLAPDYGLFRFKLAEFKLMSGIKDQTLAGEFKLALKHIEDPEGRMAEHAGNLLLNTGDAKSAKYFFNLVNK